MTPRILLVEDDQSLAAGIKLNLELEGYEVRHADSAEAAIDMQRAAPADCLILDVALPGEDGFALCDRIRQSGDYTPILFLTAKGRFEDRMRGLEAGGDDYLTKPFQLVELLTRVKVLLRRQGWARADADASGIAIGENVVDLERLEIRGPDGAHRLRPKEALILRLLVEARGKPVSRATILDQVWGEKAYPSTRTVDNFIVSLRKSLEPDPHDPRYIVSVHGVGYRLDVDFSAR